MANNYIDAASQAAVIGTVFSGDVVAPFRPAYIFDAICTERVWDRGSLPARGDKIIFPIRAALSSATAALDPTTVSIAPSQKIAYTRGSVSLELYGSHLVIDSLQLPVESFVDNIMESRDALADQALNSINLLARATMDGIDTSATYRYYGSNGTASSMGPLRAIDVRKAVASLRGDNVPTFADGFYIGVISEQQYTQLRADSDNASWTETSKYAAPEMLFRGEVGVFEGCRFIVNNQVKKGTASTHRSYFIGRDFCGKGVGFDVRVGTKSSMDGPHDNLMTMYWDALLGYTIIRRNAGRIIQTSGTAA